MKLKIGIGVIGMGWMGEVHSRSYRQISDRFPDADFQPRLVICADDVEKRAALAQQRFGFENSSTRWQDVIAHPEVRVVNIATPNHLHLEIVREAARAGKHFFCEKPVGRNPEETAAVVRAAHDAGVLSFVGYNYRWAPLVQHAFQLVKQGMLGTITHYRGRFFAGYARDPRSVLSWRFQRDQGGFGILGDTMSHVIDMAHFMAGPIKRLVSSQKTFISKRPLPVRGVGTHFTVGEGGPQGDVTNEDYAGALAEFECGAQGTLEACRVINGPQCQMAFEIHGTKGALSWDYERMNEISVSLSSGSASSHGYTRILSGPEHPFHSHFNPGPGNSLSYDDLKTIEAYQFLKSVAERRQAAPGVQEAWQVANVQSAFVRSWETAAWTDITLVGPPLGSSR